MLEIEMRNPPGWAELDVLQQCKAADVLAVAWGEERNRLIVKAHDQGRSWRAIAAAMDLHPNTVQLIWRRETGRPLWRRARRLSREVAAQQLGDPAAPPEPEAPGTVEGAQPLGAERSAGLDLSDPSMLAHAASFGIGR